MEAAPWIEFLARLGYASKGSVYVVIGLLAARVAFGAGGETTDTRGAIERIGEQPFGQVLLAILAVGLVGYAVWQLVRAFLDPERQGRNAKGIAKRIGYGMSGAAYLTLAFFAARLSMSGRGSGGGGRSEEDWTAMVLDQPFGRWLLALVALTAFAVAASQLYVAYSGTFMKRLKVDTPRRQTVKRIGQVGIAARSVVLAIVGWFFAQAAWTQNAREAGGLAEALRTLERQPYGPWLLGVVAAGLAAYGVYAIVQGSFRRIHVE